MNGFVSLVGAGPGDPDLLTVKALRLLRNADVVAYDRLIGQEVLTECRADAELIYVGKHGKECKTTWAQEDINQLLVEKARQGKTVVRLKGGDPFVFGRGGEEALALREANIPFEVVPGISSSVAAAAYAGIPVTHRKVATSFAVVAGHEDPTKEGSSVNWQSLATAVDTLVILMGVGNIPTIVAKLIVNGRDAKTPAAAVSYGTTQRQQTITSTLVDLPKALELATLQAPAAIIIGEVVKLRDQLAWFVHDITPQLHSETQTVTAWAGMLE
jgi:uroporphyrin-III C-methyltransferase